MRRAAPAPFDSSRAEGFPEPDGVGLALLALLLVGAAPPFLRRLG